MSDAEVRHEAQGGPPLPLPILASVGLFVAALVVPAIVAGQTPFVTPSTSDADLLDWFGHHAGAVRVGQFFLFGSTLPLAVFGATVSVRLQRLGIRAPGAVIALTGAVLASAFLALSAFVTIGAASPGARESVPVLRALQQISQAAGGTGYVAALGLLMAGIAVPGLLAGLLPRSLAVAGLVIAVICEVATLSIVSDAAGFLLPVGRFPALIWLIAAAFLLPERRLPANAPGQRTAP